MMLDTQLSGTLGRSAVLDAVEYVHTSRIVFPLMTYATPEWTSAHHGSATMNTGRFQAPFLSLPTNHP